MSATGVAFNSDAQIDAYAAGYLPSVTATQVAPLRRPRQRAATRDRRDPARLVCVGGLHQRLHPAKANGAPGFTGTGRVVSGQCYPPTAQQAEYAQIQLGQMPFEGSGPP